MINNQEFYTELFSQLTRTEANESILEMFGKKALAGMDIKKLPEIDIRKQEVTVITEAYFTQFSKFPNPVVLDSLANYIMADYVKDKRKKKSDDMFLTDSQIRYRYSKEIGMEEDKFSHFSTKKVWNIPQQRVTQEFSLNK